MASLDNRRHELFAQELAKGTSQRDAYAIAGYKPDDGAASRLSSHVKVKARVAELLDRAAVRTEVTVAGITERLLNIATKGEASNDAPMLSVGRAALMDVAKLNGLVVEKSEVKSEIEVTDARERLARIVAGHIDAGSTDKGAGKPH